VNADPHDGSICRISGSEHQHHGRQILDLPWRGQATSRVLSHWMRGCLEALGASSMYFWSQATRAWEMDWQIAKCGPNDHHPSQGCGCPGLQTAPCPEAEQAPETCVAACTAPALPGTQVHLLETFPLCSGTHEHHDFKILAMQYHNWKTLFIYLFYYYYYFWWPWSLNSGPHACYAFTTWITLPALFCDGYLQDRVSWTISPG
jgi:hypothetical protein